MGFFSLRFVSCNAFEKTMKGAIRNETPQNVPYSMPHKMNSFDSHFASLKLGTDAFKWHRFSMCVNQMSNKIPLENIYFPFRSHAIESATSVKRSYQRCCRWGYLASDPNDILIGFYVNARNMSQINHHVRVFFSTFLWIITTFVTILNGYPYEIVYNTCNKKRNAIVFCLV